MGIQVLEGRLLTDYDNENAARVAVVNERFVQRMLAGEEPLGKTFRSPALVPGTSELGPKEEWTIVGVIQNVLAYGLTDDRSEEVYLPYLQSPPTSTALAVHTELEPRTLEQPVRRAILSVDKDQPVINVATMDEIVARSAAQPELRSRLFLIFATLALLLAAIGIYGVLSYSVAARTHEIGIRVALGAQRGEILSSVLCRALGMVALGVGVGIVTAIGLSRLVSSALYGVTTTDPLTYAVVTVVILTVAALAGGLPAYRASKVDPIVAMREE
jgi:putative ABC transport system permease protein